MLENTENILLIVAGLFVVLFLALRLTALNRQPRRASLPRNELSPSEEQLKSANNAERAVNFFRIFTLRTNKALVGFTALVLAVLTTFFMPETALQWLGWFLVCAAILISQTAVLHYWQKWINYEERFLLKQVYQIEELILSKSGLLTSHAATGLYTRAFVEHMLELYTSRIVGRVLPVTCLVIEIVGLETLTSRVGEQAAVQVMLELAGLILKRVRISDIVYQPAWNRLGVVLLRYPAQANDVIEKHILITCHSVLEKYNTAHNCNLQIHWSGAILPIHARTPLHMLHIGEASLEAIINVSKDTEAKQRARLSLAK
jgi:GGDEF domain-containing protein